jgi:hypothetical protein
MITVVKKTLYGILAFGQSDAYSSRRVEAVADLITDIENLGRKPLKEKYFSDAEEDIFTKNGKIWLNGYGYRIEFSDGTQFIYESEDEGRNGLISQGGTTNMEAVFKNSFHELGEIFPEIPLEVLEVLESA